MYMGILGILQVPEACPCGLVYFQEPTARVKAKVVKFHGAIQFSQFLLLLRVDDGENDESGRSQGALAQLPAYQECSDQGRDVECHL